MELQNILEHALIVCMDNIIEPEHLPLSFQARFSASGEALKAVTLQEPLVSGAGEREVILTALRRNGWHKAMSAKDLGMDRTTLWRKMKSLGIHPE